MLSSAEQHSLRPHSWSGLTPEGPYTHPGSKFGVLATRVLSLVGVFWDLVQDIMSHNPRLSVPALGHTPPCLVLVNIATAVFPSLHPMGPDRFRNSFRPSHPLVGRGLGLLLALPRHFACYMSWGTTLPAPYYPLSVLH